MDLKLDGKNALVTGSTLGIGYAIAQALVREGAHVIINGRDPEKVEAAVLRLQGAGIAGGVSGIAADLSTAGGAERIFNVLPQVDILVNNLGIFEPKRFELIPDEDWMRLFEVNVMSGVRLSRHYLPLMREKDWGRIVFISSESGLQIPAEMIHYGVTKTAQIALARGLAETTAGSGITVNAVLPGPTRSEGVSDFVDALAQSSGKTTAEFEQEFFEKVRPSSLLKRFATPAEVASLVAYVCSPLASATNGAALRADGGVVRSPF